MKKCCFLDLSSALHNPVLIVKGLISSFNNNLFTIRTFNPIVSKFSESIINDYSDSFIIDNKTQLEIVYYSITETKFYSLCLNLYEYVNNARKTETIEYDKIELGMLPDGLVALWLSSFNKKELIYIGHAQETNSESLFVNKYGISSKQYSTNYSNIIKLNNSEFNERNKLIYNKYLRKYRHRYIIRKVGDYIQHDEKHKSDKSVIINTLSYAGEFDKTNESYCLYLYRGIPQKISLCFSEYKYKYQLYLFFNESIFDVFEKFYGTQPDTDTDFIIYLDAKVKNYEIALYRYGLKAPFILPSDTYELLVFKDKFENFRSSNYNQEEGAWIW